MVKSNLPCSECGGQCCTYVTMSKDEFRRIKRVHGVPDGAIIQKLVEYIPYNKKLKNNSLVIHNEDGTCPWLKDGVCSVYELRPRTCRLYGLVPEMPCQYIYPDEARRQTKLLNNKMRQRNFNSN